MATEVSRYSQTQLQNRAQKHQMPKVGKWYWSNGHTRAYGHDSQGPQRSYTCSFCRREFRSAQALGGHMNVHRRERARLHHSPDISSSCSNKSTSTPMVFSAPEFIASKRVQLFNSVQLASNLPSTILSSAIDHGNAALNLFPGGTEFIRREGDVKACVKTLGNNDWSTGGITVDELDLELRLGS